MPSPHPISQRIKVAKKKTTTVKKTASPSRKAVKKAVKKPAVKTATQGRGRPKGSTQFHTDTMAVKAETEFAKLRSIDPQPGLRRITVEVSTPGYAVSLEQLAAIIKSNPDKLAKWLKKA